MFYVTCNVFFSPNFRSRVGGPENTLLGSSDLSTIIGPSRGGASFDSDGNALYS